MAAFSTRQREPEGRSPARSDRRRRLGGRCNQTLAPTLTPTLTPTLPPTLTLTLALPPPLTLPLTLPPTRPRPYGLTPNLAS